MSLETKIIIDDFLERKIKLLGKLKGERANDIDVELLLTSVLNELIDDLIKEEIEAAGVNLGREVVRPTTHKMSQDLQKPEAMNVFTKTATSGGAKMIPDMDHDLSSEIEEEDQPMREPTQEDLDAAEKIAKGEIAPAPSARKTPLKKAAPTKQASPQFVEEVAEDGTDENVPDFFAAVEPDIHIEDVETDPEAYMEEVANGPLQKAPLPAPAGKKRQALGKGMGSLIPPPGGPAAHTKASDRFSKPRVRVSHATGDN